MSEIFETLTAYARELKVRPAVIFGDERLSWSELVEPPSRGASAVSSPTEILRNTVHALKSEETGLVFHSSGSTGTPKEVRVSYFALRTAFAAAVRCFHIEKGMSSLVAMNPRHIGGVAVATLPVLLRGGTVIFADPRNAFSVVNALVAHRPELLHMNPALLQKLGALDSWPSLPLEFVKIAILGGSPVTTDAAQVLFSKGVKRVFGCYGLTECVPPVLSHEFRPAVEFDHPVLGKPCDPELRIQLSSRDEILLQGRSTADQNQWIHTGDIAKQDGERYHFLGRSEGCGVVKDVKIYSQEIESLFSKNSRGAAFAWDQSQTTGTLYLAPSQEKSSFELVTDAYEKLRSKLGDASASIKLRALKLPLNANGKVDRLRLKSMSQEEWTALVRPSQEPSLMVTRLDNYDSGRFVAFMAECGQAGYGNNSDPEILHLDRMKEPYGAFWTAEEFAKTGSPFVGISGCHDFTDYRKDTCRVLFRSCMLPGWIGSGTKGLSKYHFNSFPYAHMLPLQIQWGLRRGLRKFVITTNTEENDVDPSGKMFRTHKIMQHLERLGFVHRSATDVEVFYSMQDIWEVNVPFLNEIRIRQGYSPIY